MIIHKKIKIGSRYIEAICFRLQDKNLIVLRGRRGYVMCGYLNLEAAERFKDAAIMIKGVSSIRGALGAKVHSLSPAAHSLGVRLGQPVKEVLAIIA